MRALAAARAGRPLQPDVARLPRGGNATGRSPATQAGVPLLAGASSLASEDGVGDHDHRFSPPRTGCGRPPSRACRARRCATYIGAGDGETAYAVQQHNIERVIAERGWTCLGRKIGLTIAGGASPARRRPAGLRGPVQRAVPRRRRHGADRHAAAAAYRGRDRLRARRRPRSAGAHTSPTSIAGDRASPLPFWCSSTAAIAGWDITFVDTVADNASSGALRARRPCLP